MVHINEGNGGAVRNSDLFNYLKKHPPIKPATKQTKDMLLNYIYEVIGVSDLTTQKRNELRNSIHSFCLSASRNWIKVGKDVSKFEKKYQNWLCKCIITSGVHTEQPSTSGSVSRRRPKKDFMDLGDRTKRRRLKDEVSSRSEEELCLAAEMKLHSVGKRRAASALHNISSSSSECNVKLRGSLQNVADVSYSAKEALALFIQLKLTRLQYIELRASAIRKNLQKLYPPYYKLLEEKAKCYPLNMQITDISAEVPLQNLLDHTVSRIAENQKEVLESLNIDNDHSDLDLDITYKWGADGSGSQKNYKQKFEKEDSDDSNLFITSLVPLRLQYTQENNDVIIWQNPRTNSTRFCRPIKIQFVKETQEVINSEFSNMDRQIANLTPTRIELCGRTYIVKHNLLKTMVDGKVCNVLSSNKSTQRCYICKATASQFNKTLDLEPRSYDPQTLNFGISPLHASIRFFECLLHISYKLPVKSWQVRGEENKQIVANRKKNIQNQFRERLGLLVDIPKQGFGNTNDGNTARRFFANPDIVHEITGIDRDLIIRFGIILKTLSCPYKINSALFNEHARDTAKLYVSLYGWYCMPPTVHKVLTHGKDIIDHFLLPIGQLGEDAQECRHKDVKYYREHNTRKMSRKQTNEDLFKILLVSSDPQISILRPLPQKQKGIFPSEVIKLLEQPNFDRNEEEL